MSNYRCILYVEFCNGDAGYLSCFTDTGFRYEDEEGYAKIYPSYNAADRAADSIYANYPSVSHITIKEIDW